MIKYNDCEIEYLQDLTIGEFIRIMHDEDVVKSNAAILVTVNNKYLHPGDVFIVKVKDGDIITSRRMIAGG